MAKDQLKGSQEMEWIPSSEPQALDVVDDCDWTWSCFY